MSRREIIRCDAKTGKTIAKHFTPGAGIIYRMAGDPRARSSPLAPPRQPRSEGKRSGEGQRVGGFQMGQVQGAGAPGTGAHGLEWREGKLWVAVPPSRMVYRIDPETWVLEKRWPTVGNRPHGIGWDGKYLWVTDSNLNAFFKHDVETGKMLEKIPTKDLYYLKSVCDRAENFSKKFWYELNPEKYEAKQIESPKRFKKKRPSE